MKSIYIKKTPYSYSADKIYDDSNSQLEILADWFTDDVGDDSKHWTAWFNNDEYVETDSNATWLEKRGSDIIFGSIAESMVIKNYEIPGKHTVTLSKQNVLELLAVWEQILKTHTNEIMIIEENGVFRMFEVQ